MKKDLSKYSDKQLYLLVKNGDTKQKEDAFAELYTRYSRGIYAYCRRILGSEDLAEDIFQETFLSFLKSTEQERDMTNVQAFLLRIARNLCLNMNRQRKTKIFSLEDFDFGIEDNRLERTEISKIIISALDLLPDEQREAVVLQIYYDMSYQDMADFLGLPLSTVRNRVTRGKQFIRQVLAPYFEKNEIKI
ncbi:RNA polymerase sigma factor [Bacteroidetes/Chlorobi group bacterium ChocPot_Mid]|jgi:RNA polymerase sigma-70 factor (ECF subfamily)|nr:MAG: RNA polymerase sigma factor [Bacteroidetes/Chlorobi group bacterium ChocPot_Mid]